MRNRFQYQPSFPAFQSNYHRNRTKNRGHRPLFYDSSLPTYVIGIDESGKCDMVGPVCFAGVCYIQPADRPAKLTWPKNLRDSKLILQSPDGLKELFKIEQEVCYTNLYNIQNFCTNFENNDVDELVVLRITSLPIGSIVFESGGVAI